MIHIILELFVSSARICAYVSESPGACAGSGIAASSKKHITHAINFPTFPPRILRKFSICIARLNVNILSRLPPRQRTKVYISIRLDESKSCDLKMAQPHLSLLLPNDAEANGIDLMVTNYVDFHLHDLPGFGKSPNCKYRGIDVQCGPRGLQGAGDALFHNNGDGTFKDVAKSAGVGDPNGYYGMGVVWADFNNTGRPDIYIANDSTPKFLYKNLGNGKFIDIGLESGTAVSEDGSEQASMGIAIGDYLHTGRPSLYVTNFSDENDVLYRNDGNWNFSDVSYASGVALPSLPYVKWGTTFADLDNDGWLDLITVTGHVYPQVDLLPSGASYREPKLLRMNQKDGTFCDASDQAGPALLEKRVSRGLAIGDLFNTGNVDVVVGDIDGAPMILKNHGVTGRHWASFELTGTESNRLAIGARIKVVASGMTQTDEVHSGGSYLSQNDLRLHFGLNTATKIDRVEIHWPSGKVDTLTDLPADQFYSVLEGAGVVPAERIRPNPAVKAKLPVTPAQTSR